MDFSKILNIISGILKGLGTPLGGKLAAFQLKGVKREVSLSTNRM